MKFSEFKEDVNYKFDNIKNDNSDQVEQIENLMEKYKNLNQEELMQEFLRESKKQKQKGELNDTKLESIKQTLTPFLSADQQKNLDYLMGIIKND